MVKVIPTIILPPIAKVYSLVLQQEGQLSGTAYEDAKVLYNSSGHSRFHTQGGRFGYGCCLQ